jgi:hypothetical protein
MPRKPRTTANLQASPNLTPTRSFRNDIGPVNHDDVTLSWF